MFRSCGSCGVEFKKRSAQHIASGPTLDASKVREFEAFFLEFGVLLLP